MSIPFVLIGQSFGSFITCLILLGFAVFLILLVLVQRGKGGGLSGAFGGMGGQSAFGTKAGDTFTRITVVTATLWILFCIVSAKYLGTSNESRFASAQSGSTTAAPGTGLDTGLDSLAPTDGTLGDGALGGGLQGDAGLGSDVAGGGDSSATEATTTPTTPASTEETSAATEAETPAAN